MTTVTPERRSPSQRRLAALRPASLSAPDLVAADEFRTSMSKLACGVVVVTTMADAQPWGVTLSSVSSFSADPARISMSVGKSTVTGQFIAEQEKFGVAILPADMQELAHRLAMPGQPKFIPDEHLAASGTAEGVPLIAGAIYNLECRVAYLVEAIDHLLVIADVVSATEGAGAHSARPLTFYDRTFGSFVTATPKGVPE